MALTAPRIVAALGALTLPLYLTMMSERTATWTYEVILVLCVATFAHRWRRETQATRAPWAWFGMGLAFWLVGDLVGIWLAHTGRDGFPTMADAFYLAGYPMLIRSVMCSARLRAPQRDVVSCLDGCMVATAVAIPIFVYWIGPAMHDGNIGTAASIVSVAYPTLDLALLAVSIRLLLGSGAWPASVVIFMAGVFITITTDIAYNVALLSGDYQQPSVIDLGWLAAFVMWTAVALMPRNAGALISGLNPYGVRMGSRTWILGVIVMIPLLVVSAAFVEGRSVDAGPVLVPLGIITVLMAIRLRLVAQRSDAAWQGTAILSVFALVVVTVAFGVTRTNAAGRSQAAAAARVDALSQAVHEGDGLVAWTLTVDPDLIARMAPQLYAAKGRIVSRAKGLDIPEAALLQRAEQRWLSSAQQQLMLTVPSRDPRKVR